MMMMMKWKAHFEILRLTSQITNSQIKQYIIVFSGHSNHFIHIIIARCVHLAGL